ncbi:MAG: M55 family metallopeptidase [Planctomycetota bacterium]
MKVYVATDLEGVAGVCRFVQTREDGPRYDEARELLTRECSACVDGLVEAGVEEVYVRDGHGRPYNFVPELLHPAARHLVGHSPDPTALLSECDAAILLAYHAMAGTPDGVLCHTQSSRGGNKYWYNGRESGEIAQHALMAGHFDIPVIMVTGDDATCREAREFLGDGPVTVSTKTGLAREGAVLLAPSLARDRIREGAKEAVGRAAGCRPYKIDLPIRGRLWFPSKETADRRRTDLGERVDDFTFEATFETALDVLRF